MPTPSAFVIFALGGTSVTVPGPPSGTDAVAIPRFVTDQSASGARWTYQLTTTKTRQWSISLADLTYAQKDALEDFFEDTAEGPNNSFTYTHTDGNSYTVRFVDTMLNWSRMNGATWGTMIRLETTDTIQ